MQEIKQKKKYTYIIAALEIDTCAEISDIISDITRNSVYSERCRSGLWANAIFCVFSYFSFVFCMLFLSLPLQCFPSRPSFSRVHRSHECACIRIPPVQPVTFTATAHLLFLGITKIRKQIRRVSAGDQNIFSFSIRNYPVRRIIWEDEKRERRIIRWLVSRSTELCGCRQWGKDNTVKYADFEAIPFFVLKFLISSFNILCIK